MIIKMDNTGQAVYDLQRILNTLEYKLVVDGVFGAKTELAVMNFQKIHRLAQDGVVGPRTMAALMAVVPTPKPPAPSDSTLAALLANSPDMYPEKGWHSDYSLALELAAKLYLVKVPCDNVALFFQSVAKAESNWKRSSVFREPAPLGYDSAGLLQLSFEDEKHYKLGFSSKASVLHPICNLVAGVIILSKLQKKHPNESIYQTGGRYWSVLRDKRYWPGKRQSGVAKVREFFDANSECKLP